MKYIDAEKVISEVKRYKNKADERLKIKGRTFGEEQKDLAIQNLCGNLLHFINSLQQEPKFKVGDTIHKIGENTVFPMTIERIYDGDYVCVTEHTQSFINIKFQDDYELVEQEQQDVDLEEEAQDEYYKYAHYESGSISGEGYHLEAQGHYECFLTRNEFKDIARHFYELGLKARKTE